jgi:hypothetical protein
MKSAIFMLFLAFMIPQEMTIPKKLKQQLKSFEPSAALYLPQTNNYLIAIDDTTEADAAMLFLMDRDGNVDQVPVMIENLKTMTDIESLSSENGFIYAMSSQSRNKKGKVLKERNLFVRGKLKGHVLVETSVVELRPELLKALGSATDIRISSMQASFDKLIEIESSYVKNGLLYVGLKDSQPRAGAGIILELGSVASIFSTGKLDPKAIKVSAILDFASAGGTEEKISDLLLNIDGTLIVTATLEDGGGSIWSFDGNELKQITSYQVEKPEGIAQSATGDLLVAFDQGDEAALFTYLTR